MKNKLIKVLLFSVALSAIAGCGKNRYETEVIEVTGTLGTPDADDETGLEYNPDLGTTAALTDNVVYASVPDKDLKGSYDSIFNTEIIMESSNAVAYLVKDGYKFTIDSGAYCQYFEGTGPVVVVGDQIQYKLVVQDKTFDEVKASDVTAKAVNAGAEITKAAATHNENGLEYITFSYDMSGERGIAINMPGPDKDHAIGVQIAVLDSQVTDEDAIAVALSVAKTAQITDEPDTTAEEIEKQYGASSALPGRRVENSTIKSGKNSYTYPVPEGFNFTYEDSSDPEIGLQEFKSDDISVSIMLSPIKSSESAKTYLEAMLMWDISDKKSDVSLSGDIAYATTSSKEFNYYAVHGVRFVDGNIFYVSAESSDRKLSLDDIIGFFQESGSEPAKKDSVIGNHTAIKSDQLYKGTVDSEEKAHELIAQYGDMQRERYNNPEVTAIELSLQSKYGIDAVNLGELDIETAKEIDRGISYMYDTYPILKGSLNTISLTNFDGRRSSLIALTQTKDFIVEDVGVEYPKVVRNEIVLNANKWLNREKMLELCKENVESGHWFKNAKDPSKVIVHELGHQLLNVYKAKEFNFVSSDNSSYMPVLITPDNWDVYLTYVWSGTALNQDVEKRIMQDAYDEWKKAGNKGDEEAFRSSISQYANGIQRDGGISYHETFAEAVADIYCNGDNAAEASKLILKQITK